MSRSDKELSAQLWRDAVSETALSAQISCRPENVFCFHGAEHQDLNAAGPTRACSTALMPLAHDERGKDWDHMGIIKLCGPETLKCQRLRTSEEQDGE